MLARVQECTKEAHIKATAYVDALATIDINDEVYCTTDKWLYGQASEVYITIYQNEARFCSSC